MQPKTINRRQAAIGIAVTLPAAGLASPAIAGGAFPTSENPMNVIAKTLAQSADRALINAGREHARIAKEIDRACEASHAAGVAYDARLPPPPDALHYRESDAALGLEKPGRWRDGEFIPDEDGLYTTRDVWELRARRNKRAMIPGYPEGHPKFGQPIPDGEPVGEFMVGHILLVRPTPARPEVAARVDEILAAMDAYHDERARLQVETGVTASEEEIGRLTELMEPAERVLIETPAVSMGGIMEKVRAVRWYEADTKSEPLSADDSLYLDQTAFLIALSLVRDLAALAP